MILSFIIYKFKSPAFSALLTIITIYLSIMIVSSISSNGATFKIMDIKYYDTQCVAINSTINCQTIGPLTVESIKITDAFALILIYVVVIIGIVISLISSFKLYINGKIESAI
jgi:hypothetical protein